VILRTSDPSDEFVRHISPPERVLEVLLA